MIFLFHGDNQSRLREEFLRIKKNYDETHFWEGELSALPTYLLSPRLFGRRELVALEDPDLKELEKLLENRRVEEFAKDVILIFERRLPPRELNRLKGIRVSTFWEEVPKNVFPHLDALLAREKKKAFLESHRLLKGGSDFTYLLNMMGWQFRNLAQVKAGAVGRISPFVVRKLRRFERNWSGEDLRRAFTLLLREDRRQKKGRKLPFDFLINRLTS